MEEKKILRKQIREKKKEYSLEEKQQMSFPIFEQIERTTEFIKSKTVLLYWSMDDEVYTHDFVNKWYKEKTVLLPCVQGDDLLLRKYEGMASMVKGEQFGILEPAGKIFSDYDSIDLMIIPGVAFDKNKNRMGRGRGFYDRLLKLCKAPKVGICFDFQLSENIPTEEFDVKMDMIVSSSSMIK
ncbi:MAG: 5-formyltetrahydrofolate cyclo-ligase [Bacteroidales bacterium]|nr:5-formyltetrahydrofolate cyclo-ligase [Bacteroidales bacterium]